jgi:hypothetical protein
MAESASKSGIKLSITTYEARTHYSYAKMKNFVSSLDLVPEDYIEHDHFMTALLVYALLLIITEIEWQQLLHLLLVSYFCFQDTRQIL